MIKESLLNLLKTNSTEYTYLEHAETKTSAESAAIRGTRLEEGAKALILRGKVTGNNVMVVVPAHKKADLGKLSKIINEELELEFPNRILERWSLQVGAVPPFGNLLDIPTYIDRSILENERASFNCGSRTASVIMKVRDMVKLINGTIGDYSQ
ncbi:MAG: YbaK/EbsC family protein [Patescibacteria group bacterium]